MGPHKDGPQLLEKLSEAQQQQVLNVMDTLLRSSHFSSAHRGQRFLRYIVAQALVGNRDELKERTIGVEVFERDPEYSTGDDAVVRVQAGDVRKRLERFFAQSETSKLPVEISLPIGTYCPEFLFRQTACPASKDQAAQAPSESAQTLTTRLGDSVPGEAADPSLARIPFRQRLTTPKYVGIAVLVLLVCVSPLIRWAIYSHGLSVFQEFWAPIVHTRQPVLLCVARADPYYPSRQFLIDHGATRTGEFNTEWQRMGKPFDLPPEQTLRWGDLEKMHEFGVATGDVYSAVQFSLAFSHMNKESQLRVGSGYQFEDLRVSPSVLIGAFNNRWTMLIGARLPYRFFEQDDVIGIEENRGNRQRWTLSSLDSERQQDYAIVARLLNTETGQPVVIVGGIGASGTQAATEFVTDSSRLATALREFPPEWSGHNVEFVISTTVTKGVAGPPSVVTSTVW